MEDDLTSYQSVDTVWRYDYFVSCLEKDITNTEALLRTQKTELERLRAHPPLYHLFNWSA